MRICYLALKHQASQISPFQGVGERPGAVGPVSPMGLVSHMSHKCPIPAGVAVQGFPLAKT